MSNVSLSDRDLKQHSVVEQDEERDDDNEKVGDKNVPIDDVPTEVPALGSRAAALIL